MMSQSDERSRLLLALIKEISEILDSGRKLNNRELLKICRDAGADGFATDPHLCHEIGETALNYLIATKYGKRLLLIEGTRN